MSNKIYHGDCLEIMRGWKDNSVDLVVTDPPYGINYFSNYYKYGNPHDKISGDDSYPVEALQEMFRIASKAVLCFMRWDNLKDVPVPKSFIVWAKNNHTAGDLNHEYGRSWEGIAFWPQHNHKFTRRPWDVIDFRRVPPTDLEHPTQKPVGLMELLISHHEGDLILDPFSGSGSTLVAAERMGRKWIGIEKEKKYIDLAESRIAAEAAQGKLLL